MELGEGEGEKRRWPASLLISHLLHCTLPRHYRGKQIILSLSLKKKTFTDCALLDQVHSLQIEKTQVFIIA